MSQDQGQPNAPVSLDGDDINILADADVTVSQPGTYIMEPTVARTLTLPEIDDVPPGAEFVIRNNSGAGDLTVSTQGTDRVNNTGIAPGSVVLPGEAGTVVRLKAKANLSAANSWYVVGN